MPQNAYAPLHAMLGLALSLTNTAHTEETLSIFSGSPQNKVHSALEQLRLQGMLAPLPDGRWHCIGIPPHTQSRMALLLRQNVSPSHAAHYLGHLVPESPLDDCEFVLHWLDARLHHSAEDTILCLECVLGYLMDWESAHEHEIEQKSSQYLELVLVAQSMCLLIHRFLSLSLTLSVSAYDLAVRCGNERFRPLIAILGAYQSLFSGIPLSENMSRYLTTLEESDSLANVDVGEGRMLFQAILHAMRGEFPKVIRCYEEKPPLPGWKYRHLDTIQASCTSQAAFYLEHYNLALGINESQRRTSSLTGNPMLSRFWMLHLAFVHLRRGDFEQALDTLDCLFSSSSSDQYSKTETATIRGLALYHFLRGSTASAYAVLKNHTLKRIGRNAPHISFEDPLILDMLFTFEDSGLPPIEGYDLEKTLISIRHKPNKHLHGAALRIAALRLRRAGGDRPQELVLLRKSRALLAETCDKREQALTAYELSRILRKTGQSEEAQNLHREVSEYAGEEVDESLSYEEMVFRLTVRLQTDGRNNGNACSKDAVTRGKSTPLDALAENCNRAFGTLAEGLDPETLLHRLVNIAIMELQAERGMLLKTQSDGSLACVVAVNLSHEEMVGDETRPFLDWLRQNAHSGQCLRFRENGLCLPLNIGKEESWVLYVDSQFTNGLYRQLPLTELSPLSCLFASEIRAARRLCALNQSIGRERGERLRHIAIQGDRSPDPVFGTGLASLFDSLSQVSQTDATVLFLGETGVGKEIMARHIHQLSQREGPFIAVHPASTPESLFESEFFGHEKGSFTGAIKQKLGFFELADGGTLFIDEVGDIPPPIQTKLLRVLQERRFIRVGGTREIHSSFRLIAATNKDLQEEVRQGRFREDLYYRLSVVPFRLPPLRERRDDIPLLIQTFITYFSRRYARPPLLLTQAQMKSLCQYDWPGNIRELKNIIERAVILNQLAPLEPAAARKPARDSETVPSAETTAPPVETKDLPSLDELERRYLLHLLDLTGGRVRGPEGLEMLLGIKPSTLYAKLKRHNIILK